MVKLQALNLQLCRKINSTTNIFQLIYLPFKSNCLSRKTSKKRVWILKRNVHYVNARYIALDFQLLQLVRSTDQWLTFYETRMNHLNGQHQLSSAINKEERETWKLQCGSSQWKVYEKYMEITIWVFWCQNKLFYVIAILVVT